MAKKASKDIVVSICTGTGGVAAGGYKVIEAFQSAFTEKSLDAKFTPRTHKVGCRGFCAKDVLVDVAVNGQTETYQFVTPEKAIKIVEEHIIGGKPVSKWLVKKDYHDFHSLQKKLVLANCGQIDPESIDEYMDAGGYHAVRKALKMDPEQIIADIKASGLRGRGGGGFPAGIKWESCRRAPGTIKYVLCNADEGDPGAFMDRSIVEGNPHAVIEGMIIGAHAIGSEEGYVYIRAEYPLAVARLRMALDQAREHHFLGEKIFGTDVNFEIKVVLGAGAFVCGESTALMTSIEDRAGEPRPKYVHTTDRGLWGKPSNLNNVETWANVPLIIDKGAQWYAGIGTETSKGTKIFSLVGKINNTGLVEVPMGIPLRDIIYKIGGGIPKKKAFKAVQTGGPSGGCIPASHLDMPVDYENLSKAGSMMGSGGMIVLDEDTCMVDMAKYFLQFCKDEGCGQCTPCREGTAQMVRLLTEITEGKGTPEHIDMLEELSLMMQDASLCALGTSAPNSVLSTLQYFREEYEAHIVNKKCPAGVCKALTTFTIDEAKCTGCTICARNCPTGAISGEKKEPHYIDQEKCVKCRVCYEGCKFDAVQKG
ncbi:MAG: NADH-quinone oxidoreductase subunit NuoF [Desulfosarcina sp.]|nr:NADH-quinone oxidoreductase subunit NuoF [Desulfosarcina sp.]MBC2744138.1 NADH-quinone oxidoreductase subunit NuoF [Desulfosarcina sp.]MBC2767047.1 NADH-quinone oxidoreductase subunit NuoF [Desulfosarcina sp.]